MHKIIEKFDVRDFQTYRENMRKILVYSESPRPARARPSPPEARLLEKGSGPGPPEPEGPRPGPAQARLFQARPITTLNYSMAVFSMNLFGLFYL